MKKCEAPQNVDESTKCDEKLPKFCEWNGGKELYQSDRSRQELSNKYLIAKSASIQPTTSFDKFVVRLELASSDLGSFLSPLPR